jgi:phenylalanyl-tRNA synthetase beta chain
VVSPPSHRFDIEIEEDLIEELARLYGYNNIPALPPIAALNMLPQNESLRSAHHLRTLLAAMDYQEVVTYSFVDAAWERDLAGNANPIKLANPIASNMSVMRSSIFGGLLDTLIFNLNRQQERVRLFEIGACFTKNNNNYAQNAKLTGLCYGDAEPEQWGVAARKVDFFDAKADIEALLGSAARFVATQHPALHPGQCAGVFVGAEQVGVIGVLHPRWQQHYGLQQGVVLFELELSALLKASVVSFSEIAKFPPLRRDIAVVVDEALPAQNLIDAMQQANIPLVSEIALFDVYRGKGIQENKKSLAFLVLMQDTQKTLTDQDADSAVAKLVNLLAQKFDAVLRN